MSNASSANTKFGVDLFRLLCTGKSGSNGFFSPLSISVALSMTQLGARGETATGMARALRWEEGNEQTIHQENQKYITLLQEPKEQFSLSLANRLFIEKGFPILPEYIQQTSRLYLADAVAANFQTNHEQERLNINSWVSEQTKEKINDLLGQGVLNNLTRMVLVNAIYFKGLWSEPFDKEDTFPRPFKVSPDETKKVPTMSAEKSYRFWIDDGTEGYSALELPYKGDELSLVILLPTDDFGLDNVLENLSAEKMAKLFSRLGRPKKTQIYLPRFEMTGSYELKDPLSQLGMPLAFDPNNADFSLMTENNDLHVSEVVHKAFVKVNEEGSEAAAATAVTMGLLCMRMVPEFVVDHPFLFVIRDKRASDSVLFMGKVVDPSK